MSAVADLIQDGRKRVVIEAVTPQVEGGRFPIKRAVGERVQVEADVFADGHDVVACALLYRPVHERDWRRAPMDPVGNDRWQGAFVVTEVGHYCYTVCGWVDSFQSWRRDLEKRTRARQELDIAFSLGAELMQRAARVAAKAAAEGPAERAAMVVAAADAELLTTLANKLRGSISDDEKFALVQQESIAEIMARYHDDELVTVHDRELEVIVDRERARCSAWYEMFPRSAGEHGVHGNFKDCIARLPYIAQMGFDVLYLPPIHPIGRTKRKGKNNIVNAGPDDMGSPWAIGAAEGGHKSVHPALGTLDDFRELIAKAQEHGIDIALDIAFQCAPDHPYVREHPQWFRRRPDGTIQYAENPPKKYEDIYPFDFETADWRALWEELKSVFLFWIDQGVRIFRVDNPHTKAFRFWEWMIAEVKRAHPDVIFLSEAFTRPKVMHHLARLGFTQSYTYFTWRNTKWELTQYFTELTQSDSREYLRPNVWPNTPDILNEYLQFGGRAAYMIRLALAATLSANYGIYGPAFELCESQAREPGSEEYLHSEKYEIRQWDLARADSLKNFIARVNRIRRENPALHGDWNLRFHAVDNDSIIAYSKHTEDLSSAVLVLVNVDPYHTHGGWLELPLAEFDIAPDQPYQVHDLLSGARYIWHGARNFIQLDPHTGPAHIFRLRRRVRSERDFDYFM